MTGSHINNPTTPRRGARGIRLADLPPAAREQATREVSRQLGAGNGETIKPGAVQDGRDTRAGAKPASRPSQTSAWFKIGAQGIQIFEVAVTATGKDWLDIVTDTGAIQRTRTDGEAEFFYATRPEAVNAIMRRLGVERTAITKQEEALMAREYPQK